MAELLVAVLTLGAAVFTTSASGKLRSRAAYSDYRAGLRTAGPLPRLPRPLRDLVPLSLAVAEVAVACGLVGTTGLLVTRSAVGYSLAEAALIAATALAAVLAAGVAVTVRRGIPVTCRCFGGGTTRPLGIAHVIRNAFLLILFAIGAAADVAASSHHARPGPADPAGSALAALAGLLVALLVVRWDDLASLLAAPSAPRDRAAR